MMEGDVEDLSLVNPILLETVSRLDAEVLSVRCRLALDWHQFDFISVKNTLSIPLTIHMRLQTKLKSYDDRRTFVRCLAEDLHNCNLISRQGALIHEMDENNSSSFAGRDPSGDYCCSPKLVQALKVPSAKPHWLYRSITSNSLRLRLRTCTPSTNWTPY
ncbi:hypothetical protein CR513_30586, partial [Mucuna pruriens]